MYNQGIIPSASGYPIYNHLTNPIFGQSLIARFKMKGIASQITTSGISEIPGEIKDTGTEIIMRREPEAEIFDYQKNQGLTSGSLTTDTFRLIIGRAKYWSLKVNAIDKMTIPQIQKYIDAYKNDAADKIDLAISREVMQSVPWEVSPYNKGACAGLRTGAYDLGNIGAPVVLTAENLLDKIEEMRTVLAEQSVIGPYICIAPYALRSLLVNTKSLLADASVSGMSKSIFLTNGEVIPDILSIKFVFSNEVPNYRDPTTGKPTYVLIFGRKDATLLVTRVVANRVIDQDKNDFATYWQGLQIYGFKVIRPEALAAMYMTISK